LKSILNSDYYLSLEIDHELVYCFKAIIDIEEMEWVSFDYAEDFDDERILLR